MDKSGFNELDSQELLNSSYTIMEIITVVYFTLHANEAAEEAWCYNFYLLLPFHCSVEDFLQNTK
jgi:hypothetical protein